MPLPLTSHCLKFSHVARKYKLTEDQEEAKKKKDEKFEVFAAKA